MIRSLTSASNIDRREACPGSAAAEAEFPEREDSEYSEEGTLLHAIDADATAGAGVKLTGEQKDVLLSSARADEEILRAVRTNMKLTDDEPFEEGREEEMYLYRGLRKLFPGHCDRWIFFPRISLLIIIDKKFGRNEVTPAETNLQLRSYAAMGARKRKAKHVVVAINQPRLKWEDRLTIAEYTEENIPAAQEHLFAVWDGAHNSDGSPRTDVARIAGENQCRYCRARIHCPEYRAKFEFLAKETEKDAFIERIHAATDFELDRVFVAIRFAESIKDQVKAEIIRRMDEGKMRNFEMKPSGSTSSISDNAEAMRLLAGIGFTKDEAIHRSKLKLTELAEDLQEKDGSTLIAAKRKLKDALLPVLEVSDKSPSLKRKHDMEEFEVIPPETAQASLL